MNGCNCRNSKCLKLYCECLKKGDYCIDCNCDGCENQPGNKIREEKFKHIKRKNPEAFTPVVTRLSQGNEKTHKKGCNCKMSNCMKNYCECR